ncbi:MAG: SDR family oxidoreductase [Clostridiales bacterium]|nr:SDR family oxidoreductase [Clostridiales bacterium]MBR4818520.1 SDR family oxidoreductase [Clostridiales bacterium]MBR5057785.1 SDR family oxidoreductase [Clostridiales bacterium]
MTKTAIVTGASSGIGKAICETLLNMDYEVYGIGRDFSRSGNIDEHGSFHKVEFNLLETAKIEPTIRDISKGKTIDLLVNCAGVGFYGLHDEIKPENISELVRTNLEVPLLLSNILLKKLKETKGTILNIASVTANQSNPHGAAYGATKAGLLSFGKSLFDEVRKHGVKVTTILPDMTDTNLYRNADFEASKEENARLVPQDVADAVRYILSADPHMVITEFTVRPQLHRIDKK